MRKPKITFPAEICKNNREHSIPIGKLTAAVLKKQRAKRRGALSAAALPSNISPTTLLFPARGSSTRPLSGWSKLKKQLDKDSGVTGWTLHDLRRSWATNMARLGTPIHVIEKMLNHASGSFGGIVSTYQRHDYWDEQVAAIQRYDDWLKSLVCR